MPATAVSLADLIQRGMLAMHAPADAVDPATAPASSWQSRSLDPGVMHLISGAEALAADIKVLTGRSSTDALALRRDLLRAIEGFLVKIG